MEIKTASQQLRRSLQSCSQANVYIKIVLMKNPENDVNNFVSYISVCRWHTETISDSKSELHVALPGDAVTTAFHSSDRHTIERCLRKTSHL